MFTSILYAYLSPLQDEAIWHERPWTAYESPTLRTKSWIYLAVQRFVPNARVEWRVLCNSCLV